MSSLYETIRRWADGQNRLNTQPQEKREQLQNVTAQLVLLLQDRSSLWELATSFYGDAGARTRRVSEEFTTSAADAELTWSAAHWQRFMQIRHKQLGIIPR